MGYTHAGGVDRPLEAWKGTGATPVMVVVPHMNWRGLFSGGTYLTGNVTTHPIIWPGLITTAWHQNQPSQQQTKVWTGSLLEGQRDASGQMYMRNRYYDPVTGQFTQTDPSGLAGGLNSYGFAAGDPVSYADPFGLCPRVTVSGSNVLIEADFQFHEMDTEQQQVFKQGVQRFWGRSRFGYSVEFRMDVPGAPVFDVYGQEDLMGGSGQSFGRGQGGEINFGLKGGLRDREALAGHEMGHGFGLHTRGADEHHRSKNNLMHDEWTSGRPGTNLSREQFERAIENCREDGSSDAETSAPVRNDER